MCSPGNSAGRAALVLAGAVVLAATAGCAALGSRSAPTTPQERRVRIREFAYTPATIFVYVGDRVTWINEDLFQHSITFDGEPGAPSSSAGFEGDFGSPLLRGGERWGWTVRQPGAWRYYCQAHPTMRGTVQVRERR